MNTIIKILVYLAKIINGWMFVIPAKLNILSTIAYIGILYFFYGTADMVEIRHIVGNGSLMHVFLGVFICVPALWGFANFMAPIGNVGDNIDGHLNDVLTHRNNMIANSSSKDAYNIMKKTAHLDVMKSSPVFRDAVIGFNATVAKDGPTEIYKDIMDS